MAFVAVGAAQRGQVLPTIAGAAPDLSELPTGCAFAPRCANGLARCRLDQPPLARDGAAALACWNPVDPAHPPIHGARAAPTGPDRRLTGPRP
jgi:oligopeptide/dipeptide ABC transporter ATP-binding protein